MKIVHLTTHGRRTGKPHRVELYGFLHTDKIVVIASNGGKPRHPDWFLNLRANPGVTLQVGKRAYAATAKIAGSKLLAILWVELNKLNSLYEGFQRKTSRTIHMVVMQPKETN